MRDYEANAEKEYKTFVNPDDEHSMEQLVEIIDSQVTIYRNRDTNTGWGKIRRVFKRLGKDIEAFRGWLGLLPTESHYMSVVCGGLKLIITVKY